jgi:hypothetical protein
MHDLCTCFGEQAQRWAGVVQFQDGTSLAAHRVNRHKFLSCDGLASDLTPDSHGGDRQHGDDPSQCSAQL